MHLKCLTGIALSLAVGALTPAGLAFAQTSWSQTTKATAMTREEAMAYHVGSLAYVYGYPVVDYLRTMHEETTNVDSDPRDAPIGAVYNHRLLATPGSTRAASNTGRTPNNDTVYYRIWMDLTDGPTEIDVPDMNDRYYTITFADLYSEVQHTGRRTTGTKAQKLLVVGPDWSGAPPPGVIVVRSRTKQMLALGRVLTTGGADVAVASSLIDAVKVTPTPGRNALVLPIKNDLSRLGFYKHLNAFLRSHKTLPGEEALMGQFDMIGIGPNRTFDETKLSPEARRGLERAILDTKPVVEGGRRVEQRGWTRIGGYLGVYGFDYLQRAAVEFAGLHANLPEEGSYPRYRLDKDGVPLSGANRYRITIPADQSPPVDAFWSLSAYDQSTYDLIDNPINRYSIGDRTTGVRKQKDGSIVIALQKDDPKDNSVNWLPVGAGDFFLIWRLYQPKFDALSGEYQLPDVKKLP